MLYYKITPNAFPNLSKNALTVFTFFIAYKLLIRYFTGTVPDKRKWGIETYIAAAVHQINCFLLGAYLMYRVYQLDDEELYGKWLSLSFFNEERKEIFQEINFLDQIFVLGQTMEMLTDFILYLRYPAFGRSYCIHHLTTMICSGSSFFATVPVGAPIVITTVMETGGLALNVVSIRLSLMPNKKPPTWMFDARLYFYTCTRVLGALMVLLMTKYMISTTAQIVCMILLYALIFVNLNWVNAMWKSKLKKYKNPRSQIAKGKAFKATRNELSHRRHIDQKIENVEYEKEMLAFSN